jgi:hypothetical protein
VQRRFGEAGSGAGIGLVRRKKLVRRKRASEKKKTSEKK